MPFKCLRRLRATPFLSLAYAELKVNFVEGFAVLATLFLWLKPFLGFNACAVYVFGLEGSKARRLEAIFDF